MSFRDANVVSAFAFTPVEPKDGQIAEVPDRHHRRRNCRRRRVSGDLGYTRADPSGRESHTE